MTRRACIALLMVLLLLPASLAAQESRPQLHELRSENLVVAYPEGLEAEARHITDLYPGIRAGLEEKLGLLADVDHAVVIVADYETFVQAVGTKLVIAFANGGRRLIALDYSAMVKRPEGLSDTLTHELCHLVLHEYVNSGAAPPGSVDLPRWLNEGTCQWASGGASELVTLGQGSELEDAVLGDRLIALRRLERAFPADDRGLRLAYEESRSAVEYIIERSGRGAMLDTLEHLRQGHGIDFAIKVTMGITYTEFEKAWQASLRRQHTWLTWLSSNLVALLFASGGVLLVLGFARAIWRYWHYQDEDEYAGGEPPIAPPPPGHSPTHRRLRSRRRGQNAQAEDEDRPEHWE